MYGCCGCSINRGGEIKAYTTETCVVDQWLGNGYGHVSDSYISIPNHSSSHRVSTTVLRLHHFGNDIRALNGHILAPFRIIEHQKISTPIILTTTGVFSRVRFLRYFGIYHTWYLQNVHHFDNEGHVFKSHILALLYIIS